MPILMQKKCPTCGGRLELISSNKYECRCCHNVYEMNEGNTSLYDSLQTASTFRESLNFKQAEMLYKNMLKKYADEDLSDVYWNLLLCEQRVMFETDQNGEQFPSFYDIAQTEIDESEYYSKAIEYAQEYDSNKLMCFVDLANKMKEAKNKYRTIKSTTKPYDIFICFKKSGIQEPNKFTKDYQLAIDLYNNLSKDYRVFFSERSLNNIVVREYEPNIYHALYTAKIMIVICSNINYLESQWVRNEWSRFKMMSNTTAQAKSIIPIFRNNFQPEQLPYELRNCQGIAADTSMMLNITNAVKEILRPVDKQTELTAKFQAELQAQKAEMEAQIKAQMEALKKQFATQNMYQNYQQQTTNKPTQAVNESAVNSKSYAQKMSFEENLKNFNQLMMDLGIDENTETAAQSNSATTQKPITPNYIVPYGTKTINVGQFANRYDLTKVVIPNTVTNIESDAFNNCNRLTNITIPNSVTSIGNSAFYTCINLNSIILPSSVTYIGFFAFAYCGIMNINIPNGITTICESTFYKCTQLISIVLPNSIISIEPFAFAHCGLTNIIIPDGVTNLGRSAFAYCSKLTSITIPNSVTNIGECALLGSTELLNITYIGTKRQWKKIRKYKNWDTNTGEYIVRCTDGDIKK